jgi:SSS family solute:Na+ symporter
LLHYFPTGILGLGLTALLASFMSGMAGNVTAFNTVWTYDIYHSYINKGASDKHLLWMGRSATVWGIALSVAAAYVASQFNNIMDMLQMVFGYVNAPLFATFALGMFWRRTSGHGAFFGLISGTLAAATFQSLTGPKGGWIATVRTFPSDMAQNFWMAIWAFSTCLVVTIVISLFTKPRPAEELRGLVYSLTPKPEETERTWWKRPGTLAIIVLLLTLGLNFIFR